MADGTPEQVQEFESIRQIEVEGEFWSARDLMPLLGYDRWENFTTVIAKAETACDRSGYAIKDHFRKVTKMIETGKGAMRPSDDYRLTRYACYLIAQNGSPQKPEVASAQTYFAIQTRRQEIGLQQQEQLERIAARHKLTQTEKEFASELVQRDIDGIGIG